MNKTTKIALGVIILLLIIWGISSGIKKGNEIAKSDTIKIGAILSLTGPAVQDATSIKEGAELALKDFLKSGKKAEIIYCDDGTDPKKTVSCVQYLKTQGAEALLGFTWDFLYSSALPSMKQVSIVGITPSNTSEYAATGEYGFSTAPKTAYSEKLLTEFLIKNKIKRIAFIASKFGFSEVHLASLKRSAKEAGAEVVIEELMVYGTEADTMNTLMIKVKNSKPDLIFPIFGSEQAGTAFFKKINQFGIKVPIVAGGTFVGAFAKNNPKLVGTEYPLYSLVPNGSIKFVNHFTEEMGKNPGEYVEYAYDTFMILTDSVERSRASNKSVLEVLLGGKFKGYNQEYSFDKNHDSTTGYWQIRKDN